MKMAGKIHNAFDNIKANSQLKQSTKQFISEKYNDKTLLKTRPITI